MEKPKALKRPHITVIGAVNVDISGTAYRPLILGDSNPGRLAVNFGGVGRNIAVNLCNLGASVRLVTVLGDDIYGLQAKNNCLKFGLDLRFCNMIPGEATSSYLCINEPDGDVHVAVSDMEICRHINPSFLSERLIEINRSELVVLDANLSEEAIAYLAEHVTVPVFADPVSVTKAERMKKHIKKFECIKPNRPEAEVLTGIHIQDHSDLLKAAQAMHEKGVGLVFISLGPEGVFYDDGRDSGIIPCVPGPVNDTTGCGDAFMAGAAFGACQGKKTRDMARMGLAASSLCAETIGAVREDLSYNLLKNKLEAEGETKWN